MGLKRAKSVMVREKLIKILCEFTCFVTERYDVSPVQFNYMGDMKHEYIVTNV